MKRWNELATRHIEEQEAMSKALETRYSLEETGKVTTDPELLALSAKQRAEMQAHFDKKALPVEREAAFNAVLRALGSVEMVPNLHFVPNRNEEAILQARAKYGTAFVDSLVARESELGSLFQ